MSKVSTKELPAPSRRGRPQDPLLNTRVYEAAFEVYGEVGWAGFSLDAVAKRAKAGKMALYKRWECKEKLIHDTLEVMLKRVPLQDTGSVRTDLIQLANFKLDTYLGRHGMVLLRAQVEAKVYPELFGPVLDKLYEEYQDSILAIIRRGVQRGELPPGTSPGLVVDAVGGILTNHVLGTPTYKMASLAAKKAKYAEETVDFVLSAVGYRQPDGTTFTAPIPRKGAASRSR
jgi:AcrR family transcriptional regulator